MNPLPAQGDTMDPDAEHRAYFAHDAETYVCFDCATNGERQDPVPDGDAAGEQCARCTAWWEYADA